MLSNRNTKTVMFCWTGSSGPQILALNYSCQKGKTAFTIPNSHPNQLAQMPMRKDVAFFILLIVQTEYLNTQQNIPCNVGPTNYEWVLGHSIGTQLSFEMLRSRCTDDHADNVEDCP